MSIRRMSEGKLLAYTERVIENSLASPKIVAVAEERGYDRDDLRAARDLVERLRAASARVNQAMGEQKAATTRVVRLLEKAKSTFGRHRKVCRRELKNHPGAIQQLRIEERPPRSRDAWVEFAQGFYRMLRDSPDVMAEVADRGLTTEVVASAQENLRRLIEADQIQTRLKADVQRAMERRLDARHAVRDWFADYLFYLKQDADVLGQELEALDQVVPTDPDRAAD